MLRIHRAMVRRKWRRSNTWSGSRSSYGAERNARPKSQRVPPVRRSVAKPELKPRAVSNRALHGANADGSYELGPRTYRMLKNELDHLMLSAEHDLPNSVDLTCDAEKDIVERWRNEMGDNLKDVLGLNVTKRLLNVFNPLNVKVHFTTKPDRKYLSTFLKRYNFVAFKRLAGVVNTFAAQVRDIADFDALCTARSVHCGAAKITIRPFYRFTQCPKKVKTVFCNPDYMNYKRRNDLSNKLNKTKDDSFTSTKSEEAIKPFNTDVTKETSQAEQVVNKPTTNNTLNVDGQKIEAKTTALTSNKTSTSKIDINVETPKPKVETLKPKVETLKLKVETLKPKVEAPKPKVETPKPKVETPKPKVEAPKPKVETPKPKVETPKPIVETPKPKVEALKPKVAPSVPKLETPTSKVEAPKTKINTPTLKVEDPTPKVGTATLKVETPAPKSVPAAKAQTLMSATESNTTKPKVNTPKPIEPVKTKVGNKQQIDSNKTEVPKTNAKVDDKTKNTVKAAVQTKNVANVKAVPAKTVAKVTTNSNTKITKSPVTAKNVPAKKNIFSNKKATKKAIEKDDYEELDDHDILALISEGIVLDECSGSDED